MKKSENVNVHQGFPSIFSKFRRLLNIFTCTKSLSFIHLSLGRLELAGQFLITYLMDSKARERRLNLELNSFVPRLLAVESHLLVQTISRK